MRTRLQQRGERCSTIRQSRDHNVKAAAVAQLLILLLAQHAAATRGVPSPGDFLLVPDGSLLARSLLQGTPLAPPPTPPAPTNQTSNTTRSSSSGTKSGNKFSAFVATTIAASTGAIGVVSGVAGVAAANLGAGTVIQAAGALNMQATSAALVNLIQHVQIFAAMDAPVQQLALNSTYRDSVTKNITDALSWITFSTRSARCRTGAPGERSPSDKDQSECLWRSGKNHVVVIAIVLGIAVAIHALLVLLWNITIGFVKPMPVILVPPNLEIMLAGVFILPLAAATTQLIAADTRRSITLAAFVIAFLGAYVVFLVYVLLGIVPQKQKYGLTYKRSVSSHGPAHKPGSGQGGSGGAAGGSSGKAMQRSASARRQLCMNVNWPQWHGEWEVQGVPEDQMATYRKQYVRTSRWYGFMSRIHRPQQNGEAAKVLAVEIEDRLGGLHDPYRGDNILAYNWELVKLGYLVAQGVLLAATEASLEVGAMSWSLLWLQVAYTGLMTVLRPSRNQWLGWLDIAANWVRVGTFIAFIQLANRDDNLRKNLLTHLELTSIGIELLSTWVRILSMFIKVEGIYFAIKKPKFLSWAHKSIKHTMPFTADHINRVEATAAEVERVRSGRLPDISQDSSPLLKPSGATASIITPQAQAEKPPGRDTESIKKLPEPSDTTRLIPQSGPGKKAQKPVGGRVPEASAAPEEIQVQVPGKSPSAAKPQKAPVRNPDKTPSRPVQSAVPDVAATVQLPEVSHLPAVKPLDQEEGEEEDIDTSEALAVPVAVAVTDQVPGRFGSRLKPTVLQPEPAPEKLGDLWQGGLGGRVDPPAPVPPPTDSAAPAAVSPAQASATTPAASLKPLSSSRRFTQPPQSSPGPAPAAGTAGAYDAFGAASSAAISAPIHMSGGSSGQHVQETGDAAAEGSGVPSPVVAPLQLGAAKYHKASFRSEGADMYHSVDSEFDEGGRIIGEDLGFQTGEMELPTQEPQTPEMHTYQDMVVDEILKGMLMDIMCSRPNSMSSHVGPLVGGAMDTAEEEVEEALKRVLDHMQSVSLDSGEEMPNLNVELLRMRLIHLHQDLLASWHHEPTSPFRPQSPSFPANLQDPEAIRTIRRAYSTRNPSQVLTPARRQPAMRASHTMPAAVASAAADSAMAATPAGRASRSQSLNRAQTSAAHRSRSQEVPYTEGSGAVGAQRVEQSTAERAEQGPVTAAASEKELKRAYTAEPSRTVARDTPASLPYSRSMPAAVATTVKRAQPSPAAPAQSGSVPAAVAAEKEFKRARTTLPSRTQRAAASLPHSQTMPAATSTRLADAGAADSAEQDAAEAGPEQFSG